MAHHALPKIHRTCSVPEAAELIEISRQSVDAAIRAGDLKASVRRVCGGGSRGPLKVHEISLPDLRAWAVSRVERFTAAAKEAREGVKRIDRYARSRASYYSARAADAAEAVARLDAKVQP